jgi:uncharacterized protein
MEYRSLKAAPQVSQGALVGLVTPFNTWTQIGNRDKGGFDERVAPGAFAASLRARPVILLHNHDTALVVASTQVASGPGSLSLHEDPSAGLRMSGVPLDTQAGRDVRVMAQAGVLRMSFGFEVVRDSWQDDQGRASNSVYGTRRTIHEVRLMEVTTTAFPAYPTTYVAAA